MTEDLIKRLRMIPRHFMTHELGAEAAVALENQAKRIAELEDIIREMADQQAETDAESEAQISALTADLAAAREALDAIWQYGADTLSGRIDGPDDREWQRGSVREMTKRAREGRDAFAAARGEHPNTDATTHKYSLASNILRSERVGGGFLSDGSIAEEEYIKVHGVRLEYLTDAAAPIGSCENCEHGNTCSRDVAVNLCGPDRNSWKPKYDMCPSCHGTGYWYDNPDGKGADCKGTGTRDKKETK